VLRLATGTWTHKTHHGSDLRVSHHLTPYSILCDSLWHPRLNVTFSRDSQSGVPKLSQVGVPGFWDFIAPRPDLRAGWDLNQSCSPQKKLFNTMLHSQNACREQVDSRLLVGGSQIASLTPGPSFAPNLGCRCPNDQMRGHFRYLRFKTFSMTLKTPQCEVFWALLSSSKHSRVPGDSKSPSFPSVRLHPHTWPN
jgi:hypothetical protein